MVTTISPSVFLSKCESRLRDERASKLSRLAGVCRGPRDARFSRPGVGIRRRNPERSRGSPSYPEDTSFSHAVSGNSLHNFVLENLFVDNEIAGVGRTPWRSMANDTVSRSFDSHFPSQAQGRARSGRQRDTVFSQTETLPGTTPHLPRRTGFGRIDRKTAQ